MITSWYPRYPGDYKRDTSHLSLAEHGAYTLLLDHYYTSGPIPANADANAPALALATDMRIYRICCAFDERERNAVDSVLQQFFVIKDGYYTNKRMDKEIAKRDEIREKRRLAAEAMHEKKKNKCAANARANAPAQHDAKEVPTTTTTTDSISGTKVPSCTACTYVTKNGEVMSWEGVIDYLWKDYPRVGRTIRSKDKMGEQLKKILTKEGKNETDYQSIIRTIAGAIREYRHYCERTGEKQPDPWRWLRDGGYKDTYEFSETADRGKGPGRGEGAGTVNQIVDAAEQAKKMLG